ncbi:glycosyltransferase involved in cell wall biosynthesis [Flavobacterium sp. CG_23.5]|uniref:glycosyltransferase family 2 protein n=1 Tax=Flavobacterium sp. CG_23.5 TaxID=2760708 RepID=UPI001AE564C7|nr:glycosyltransferase family 2 protein [Flavobacterium sp. CG_23.5]MBP2283045.1 glycosyltransferase involved in cell wall biosynthesis [Flavobacterium sp. CG_23.5]
MGINEKKEIIIAIVIPYYKITFFEKTLESLANQTDKRFKVYIGDDNSPQNPMSLLVKYEEKINFSYCKFEDNLGSISLVKQWDRCIALSCDEEWVMVLCDDDYISYNHIEEFYKNVQVAENLNIKVIRYATCVNESNGEISNVYDHPIVESSTDFFFRRITNATRSSLSEYVFKKSTYEQYGFFNYALAWHSDDRAWLEFSEFKYIYSINTAQVYFRLSEENISRSDFKIKEKNQASLAFYNFLIFIHIYKFKRLQRKELLLVYEQFIYKINKVNFSFFVSVFTLLFINLYFVQSLKFARRLLIHLNKNVHSS